MLKVNFNYIFYILTILIFTIIIPFNLTLSSSSISPSSINLPLYFIKNNGQIDKINFSNNNNEQEIVEYYIKLPNQLIYFTKKSIYFINFFNNNKEIKTIKLSFNNNNKNNNNNNIEIIPLEQLEGKVNYFIGNNNNKNNWKTDIPTYNALLYKNVNNSNVNIKFYIKDNRLKYDIIINPSNKKNVNNNKKIEEIIQITYENLDDLIITEEDNLKGIIKDKNNNNKEIILINQEKPIIYQEDNNNTIEGKFIILEKDKKNKKFTFSFKLIDEHKYDKTKKLIIDPPISTLYYSTYLGGSNDDYDYSITIPPISTLYYSTYLGGSNDDYAYSITIDNLGYAYITGHTQSTDFPTSNAFQETFGGGFSDAFITKLSTSGDSIIYSTYLGGSNDDTASGITIDNLGYAYIIGNTLSNDFPTKNPYQSTNRGSSDVFISKISEIRIQFTFSSSSNNESVNTANIEISLPSTSTEDISVNYAISGGTATVGSDYTLVPTSLTIPAGQTTTTLTINIINDNIDEPDETIILSLFSPVNALLGENHTFTYTILDDDLPSNNITSENRRYIAGGIDIFYQVKYLLERNEKEKARKIIKEYIHLFKKEYLLKNYPNLYTKEQLSFISSITSEKSKEILEEIEKIIKKTDKKNIDDKYSSVLKENYLIKECSNIKFTKTLRLNSKNKEVKCLKIILNLDKETRVSKIGKETNLFDNKTRLSVIKFQKKYNIKKDKKGIVGKETRKKLNEILRRLKR